MRRGALTSLLVLLVAACSDREPVRPKEDFQPRPNYLTMGDAAAGRMVFYQLKCGTCHPVAGEPISSHAAARGPELGTAEAFLSPDEIARAIVAPAHSTSTKPGPWREGNGVGMTEYANVMTVRQLMDLVAYIRSLPGGGGT